MNWRTIWEYLLARAKEKTTWPGLAAVAASLTGYVVAPDKIEAITLVATSIATLLTMGLKEKGSDK
jgi:hypothetical protein